MEALKFASSAGFMQWAERVVNEKDQTYGRALIGKQTWTYGDGYRVETKWGQKGGTVLSSLKYMLSTATEAMEHSRDAQIVKDIDARSGVVLTIGWSRQATTDGWPRHPTDQEQGSSMEEFVAAAWWGGNACGLKLRAVDRDKYLKREWGSVNLVIPGEPEPTPVNIDKASMWEGTCRELIHIKIKAWFIRAGKFPWPKGSPPRVRLVQVSQKSFAVSFT